MEALVLVDHMAGQEIVMQLFVMFLKLKLWKIITGGILLIRDGVAIAAIPHGIAGNNINRNVRLYTKRYTL